MASTATKKPCTTCSKSSGVFTCDGCQRSFCWKHADEHRQELTKRMDEIGQEFDLFQRDLICARTEHLDLSHNHIREQLITPGISSTTDAASATIQQSIIRKMNLLETFSHEIGGELRSSRQSEDYTEIDFRRWTEKLNEMRKTLENLSSRRSADARKKSPAAWIEGSNQNQLRSYTPVRVAFTEAVANKNLVDQERFEQVVGAGQVSSDGLVALCRMYDFDHSVFSGVNLYSSGKHDIHFGIGWKGGLSQFYGIVSSSQNITSDVVRSSSSYGWWELDQPVRNGRFQIDERCGTIRTGDLVTLTLDCDNAQIFIANHRTNQRTSLEINLRTCPFPWKMVVLLHHQCDYVQIVAQ